MSFTRIIRLHYKRQVVAMCIFVIVFTCTKIVFKLFYDKTYVIFLNDPKYSIYCHYEVKEDALPLFDEESFHPQVNSIFFHETSCQGGLDSRQACSVESAARMHHNRSVYVFFSGPVTYFMLHNSILAKLQEIPNVHFIRIHIEQYAKDTPLESLIRNKTVDDSPYCVYHSADILRSLTLYKWSGIYLDTDIIVVKNLEPLGKNWITKEDSYQLNTAAFALSNDELAIKISESIVNNTEYKSMISSAYAYHVWNQLSQDSKVQKDSPYDKLAREFCPTVYKTYGDDFGS